MGETTMKRHSIVFLFLVLLVLPTVLVASGKSRAGTSAAPELTIPIGARYLGSGGSAIATAIGLESVFWNPGGVDRSPSTANAMFSYRSYIADMNVSFASVSGKFGFGTLALSLRSFGIGDIPVTTETSPDGTGEILKPSFFVVGFTYSKQLSDRTSVGATVNLINESFGSVQASGVSFDMGVQYRNLVGIEGLAVGVTVKNIGPGMQYGGSGLWQQADAVNSDRGVTYYKVGAATFDLPSLFELGFSYERKLAEDHSLTASVAYENSNYAVDEYRVGIDYGFKNLLHVRAGYFFLPSPTGDSRVTTPSVFKDFTVGFGVSLGELTGANIDLDYAYVPGDLFSDNNLITINIGF
jgi:hypothetical protein